jgi:hypothetical protein
MIFKKLKASYIFGTERMKYLTQGGTLDRKHLLEREGDSDMV